MTQPAIEIRTQDDERPQVSAVSNLMGADPTTSAQSRPVRVRVGDTEVELPRPLIEVLVAAAGLLDEGATVAVVGEETEVSPAQAAKLLGVSRQYVDRLVADEVLVARRLPRSSYRKIPVRAVLAHRAASEAKRVGIRRIIDEGTAAGIAY